MSAFHEMIARHAQPGQLKQILMRPARLDPPVSVAQAVLRAEGRAGDHGRPGKRALRLIQSEHIAVIGAMLRRNLIVWG